MANVHEGEQRHSDPTTSLLRMMLETLPDLVWLKDANGTYLGCNPAFSRFFGASEAEIVGKTDYDFVDAELAHSFRENDLRAIEAGRPSVNEEWITFADDGHRALVETIKTPMFDDNNQLVGVLGIAREVTELRAAEAALSERAQYLRSLIDSFPFLVWLKDTEGRFLAVNQAFAKASDSADTDELAGKTDLDVWPADLAEAYRADDRAVMATLKHKAVEEEILEQGALVWYETFKAPVVDDSGDVLGTVGFSRDITERRLGEEGARRRDALLMGLSYATDHILSGGGLSGDNITDALRALGELTSVDRVYIFEHVPGDPDSRGFISQRYEWSRESVEPQIDNPELQNIPWDDIAPRWHDILKEGGYVAGDVADFPDDERAVLEPQGIISLLVLPIELDRELWGFIGFDACGEQRRWNAADLALLNSVANVLAVAIGRMRSESALRENEENFRTFFDTMTDIVVVGRPDGTILYANPTFTAKLGYEPAESSQMHVLDLHPEELRTEAEAIFGAMFAGESDCCPLPLQAKSGALVPVETRVWLGKWNGEDCIFGVSKDLTREQEALQKFDRLFHGNPAPMAVSDIPATRFVDVNDAFVKTLGFSREEILGRTSDDLGLFVEPEKQQEVAEQLRLNGRITEIELKVRHKDGTLLDGLFNGEIIQTQGQAYFLTVMNDITELKQATAAAQALTSMIDVISSVSEMRDPYTAGHQRRVAELAYAIAREMGLPESEIADIRVAALVHDVGKISIPAEILSKPTDLSPLEASLLRGHVEAGYSIIAAAYAHGPFAEYVHQHHELCDGSGYPRGLKASELLTGSKVLVVADVVENAMSHRPNRAGVDQEVALAEIEQEAGRLYDAGVVDACVRVFREQGFKFSEFRG